MILFILFLAGIVLIPSSAFAWGPLTHIYIGSEMLKLGSLLPASVYALIRRHKDDFLYGNLMADAILAKQYLPQDKNPHSWEVARALSSSAMENHEKAFAMGYFSHLAADTVAHGIFTAGASSFEHTMLEIKADRAIHIDYWLKAMSIKRDVQRRGDDFMAETVERALFSFKTNKNIFRGVMALSCLRPDMLGFSANSLRGANPDRRGGLIALHAESISRAVDVLKSGSSSEVMKLDPIADFSYCKPASNRSSTKRTLKRKTA